MKSDMAQHTREGGKKSSLKNLELLTSSFSFIAPSAVVDIDAHHCYHVCVSIRNPFDCVVNGVNLTDTWGIIVNQNVPHSCSSPMTSKLIHFIDPESAWGLSLKRLLAGAPFIEMTALQPAENFPKILPPNYASLPVQQVQSLVETFLYNLFKPYASETDTEWDPRIVNALTYINNNLSKKILLKDVADHISLSSERTRHFFIESIGIPFSQYIIWKRIRGVTSLIIEEKLLPTEACGRLGFTDYSHFSRLFKRMFGMPPGHIFSNTRIIL